MTHVLITIDAELSSSREIAGMPVEQNLAQQYFGRVDTGGFGVTWLMDQMARRDIKGVFFVDPMAGMVHGQSLVDRMIAPILANNHDVQIHIHTEWLNRAKDSPVSGRTGRNIGDFSLDDQVSLIGWARDALVRAGAPSPTAFRAGNFGANDDTLRALARLGLQWDSSYNADYAKGECRIGIAQDCIEPIAIGNVWEIPIAGLWDTPGHFRPAQVCAISSAEMRAALHHAAATQAHSFVAVTHSFEMLSRDRRRLNPIVMNRFKAMCDTVARHPDLIPATFKNIVPPAFRASRDALSRLGPSRVRTFARMAEQGFANLWFERPFRSAWA